MKIVAKMLGISTATLAVLFAVYYYNLDMKLHAASHMRKRKTAKRAYMTALQTILCSARSASMFRSQICILCAPRLI